MTEKGPADGSAASEALNARAERTAASGLGTDEPVSNVRSFTQRHRPVTNKAEPVPVDEPAPQEDQPEPDRRRGALLRLLFVLLLVAGGLLLVHELAHMSQFQDCVMSGRTNCAPITVAAPGG